MFNSNSECKKTMTNLNSLSSQEIEQNSRERNIKEKTIQSDFYSPLSRNGYLTPLQRKKLREKRNWDAAGFIDDIDPKEAKKVKRQKSVTLKKKGNTDKRNTKSHIAHKKITASVPQVRCTLPKILNKTVDYRVRENKFFKTSSSSRLEKVNFTLPLVLNKNIFNKFNSSNRRYILSAEENKLVCQDNDVTSKNSKSSHDVKRAEISVTDCENGAGPYVNDNQPMLVAEQNIFDFQWPSDDVLLKRQEIARSHQKDRIAMESTSVKTQDIKTPSEKTSSVKYYPIFNFAMKKKENSQITESAQLSSSKEEEKVPKPTESNDKHPAKYIKDSSKGEQMIIDAGQREIGPKMCSVCSMLYTVGQIEDEKLHSSYHSMFLINLKFPGWKEENVIGEYCDGRVIKILKSDKRWKLKKIEDVLLTANRDLGFPTAGFPTKPDVIFILFISNEKRVAGCVVAEPITSACQVLLTEDESKINDLVEISKEKIWRIGNWYSSTESLPAVCGINRIWVCSKYRRCKVASRMIDCLRCNFIHGHIVDIRELAFTDPSPDGREFAAAYTGTDNFLVYNNIIVEAGH